VSSLKTAEERVACEDLASYPRARAETETQQRMNNDGPIESGFACIVESPLICRASRFRSPRSSFGCPLLLKARQASHAARKYSLHDLLSSPDVLDGSGFADVVDARM
jgi:hypothetical protein